MTDTLTKAAVWDRAAGFCEYCGLHQDQELMFRFHIEHIVPKKHGGSDEEKNLALACYFCNLHKGPNLTGIDPDSGHVAALFDPRRQKWKRHFAWRGPVLIGKTKSGRATINVLEINHTKRIELREALIDEGVFPPTGPIF